MNFIGLAGAPVERPRQEQAGSLAIEGYFTAATSALAPPCIPALLGWTGAASSPGISGSTQRVDEPFAGVGADAGVVPVDQGRAIGCRLGRVGPARS
jgi:hypothetical protein